MTTDSPTSQPAGEPPTSFKSQLIGLLPNLRAFAISLTARSAWSDDLVQETLVKAWAARDRFEPGSNLKAWLFTILRNEYFNRLRSLQRESGREDLIDPDSLSAPSPQMNQVKLNQLQAALVQLKPEQREAIVLVGASGFTYEEAAEIAGVAVGTIKSRVARGREELNAVLEHF